LEIAKNAGGVNISYNAIRLTVRRIGFKKMEMGFCRKLFDSYLRQSGIESEIVDLLQERVSKSVFARHYFIPKLEYRVRVIQALVRLNKDIEW
jgi:intergrase/recombinase